MFGLKTIDTIGTRLYASIVPCYVVGAFCCLLKSIWKGTYYLQFSKNNAKTQYNITQQCYNTELQHYSAVLQYCTTTLLSSSMVMK